MLDCAIEGQTSVKSLYNPLYCLFRDNAKEGAVRLKTFTGQKQKHWHTIECFQEGPFETKFGPQ